jgi:hypothetical protein
VAQVVECLLSFPGVGDGEVLEKARLFCMINLTEKESRQNHNLPSSKEERKDGQAGSGGVLSGVFRSRERDRYVSQ